MSDMTQSFIEMVEAYKAKPELESQIASLKADNAMCYGTIDQLRYEMSILEDAKKALETKLSEVTKERDDASFRNLELDEKLAGIEKLLGVAERLEQARKLEHQATVDALMPKPLVEAAVVTEQGSTIIQPGPIDPVVVQGQSAADPMSVGQPETDTTTSKDGIEPTQTPSEPKINPYSGFPIHYPDGEYKGQPYYDKPSWVSWAAWVDAGGEAEPYMKNFG